MTVFDLLLNPLIGSCTYLLVLHAFCCPSFSVVVHCAELLVLLVDP